MPTYAYHCQCGHEYEKFKSLMAPWPEKCPACEAKWGDGFHQKFTEPNVSVRGIDSAKTFGQAAEENAKRVGKDKIQEMVAENKARLKSGGFTGKLPKGATLNTTGTGETPPWRDGSMGTPAMEKPLDVRKVKDPKKYIETGKMN